MGPCVGRIEAGVVGVGIVEQSQPCIWCQYMASLDLKEHKSSEQNSKIKRNVKDTYGRP